MRDPGLMPPGTWWAYYADHHGRRCVLTISIEHPDLLLTTAGGTVLRFTCPEAGMLLENLDAAVAHLTTGGRP
ncbi:hypothetical protein [Gandjariella thermophila]|uniref:DUF397 domain-containing protein n=1 Tax=Gandjariella thermophila TaxID=1931992 RepID=A0A4D4JEA3_9PSEU|nr:hypothetical protein [Gandjariella thermophila]GDY33742.1 hypothetical protein GTS_53750 [Gandjariella thermophila]